MEHGSDSEWIEIELGEVGEDEHEEGDVQAPHGFVVLHGGLNLRIGRTSHPSGVSFAEAVEGALAHLDAVFPPHGERDRLTLKIGHTVSLGRHLHHSIERRSLAATAVEIVIEVPDQGSLDEPRNRTGTYHAVGHRGSEVVNHSSFVR
ncbi:hypothetical protein BH23PLA1_BH23PLA1_39560 [soil metagenome]